LYPVLKYESGIAGMKLLQVRNSVHDGCDHAGSILLSSITRERILNVFSCSRFRIARIPALPQLVDPNNNVSLPEEKDERQECLFVVMEK